MPDLFENARLLLFRQIVAHGPNKLLGNLVPLPHLAGCLNRFSDSFPAFQVDRKRFRPRRMPHRPHDALHLGVMDQIVSKISGIQSTKNQGYCKQYAILNLPS